MWRVYRKFANEKLWNECVTAPIYSEAVAHAIAEILADHYVMNVSKPAIQFAIAKDSAKAYIIVPATIDPKVIVSNA